MAAADDVVHAAFVPVPRASVLVSYLDDQAVLYDTASRCSALLNQTSMVIWSSCDGRGSVSDICDVVARLFEMPVVAVQPDVYGAIRQFGDRGFLDGIDVLPEFLPPES